MADEITKEEFNFYQINKSEKRVALPALKEVFKTLWEKEFPEEPWEDDRAFVEKFEENVKNACTKRAASRCNPQRENKKITIILVSLQKDESWYKCDWDISTLSKVLLDCRLFDLEGISVELSDHIKGITDIRNKTAHSTAFKLEEQEFEDTMNALKKHLEGMKCVISIDHYLQTLEQIESQETPTSRLQHKEMSYEIEIMKVTLKLYQEKEHRLLDRELFQKEKLELERDNSDLRAKLLSQKHEMTTEIKDTKNDLEQMTTVKAHLEKETAYLEQIKILQHKQNIQLKKNNKKNVKVYNLKLAKYKKELDKCERWESEYQRCLDKRQQELIHFRCQYDLILNIWESSHNYFEGQINILSSFNILRFVGVVLSFFQLIRSAMIFFKYS